MGLDDARRLHLYVGLERRLGSLALILILGGGHLVSTVAFDLYLRAQGSAQGLAVTDYGTSCMICAAAGALLYTTRSRILLIVLLAALAGDVPLHSPATVSEHTIATTVGLAVALTITKIGHRRRLTSATALRASSAATDR